MAAEACGSGPAVTVTALLRAGQVRQCFPLWLILGWMGGGLAVLLKLR